MADTIKILGQEAGDDYTTIADARADIPANIVTHGGDNWVIQVRSDANYGSFQFPLSVTDATHKIIVEAFSGDEVDGTGTGAGFVSGTESATGGGVVGAVTTSTSESIVEIRNLKIISTDAAVPAIRLGSERNKVFSGCFISGAGSGIEIVNSSANGFSLINCIIADCGGEGTNWRNANASSDIIISGLTVVNSVGSGLDDRGFGSAAFIESVRNVFCFDNSLDFRTNVSDSNVDYLASGDTTATAEAATTGYNNRTTADFVDYAGGNYNLASGSSLVGLGEGGADIGATLGGAATPTTITASGAGVRQLIGNQYMAVAASRLNGVLQ